MTPCPEKQDSTLQTGLQQAAPHIRVTDLTMAYGRRIIQENLTFDVARGDIFIIMGGSGCGKSTLMRHLIGLSRPMSGDILYNGVSLWKGDAKDRREQMKTFGVLYQSGALWSTMTLAQNIALPLEMHTRLDSRQIRDLVGIKLELVGLAGYEDHYPSEISGGMKKRAGLARALALDPEILFFDEPSAGLDPVSAKHLDDLILALSRSLGTTIVVVTHELASIFAIGTNSVFLDPRSRTQIGRGAPRDLLEHPPHPDIAFFLNRGTETSKAAHQQRTS